MPSTKKKKTRKQKGRRGVGRPPQAPPPSSAGKAPANDNDARVAAALLACFRVGDGDGDDDPREYDDADVIRYQARMTSLPPEVVVEDVRRGSGVPTWAITKRTSNSANDLRLRRRLADAGILPAALGLLGRCADASFAEVLADVRGGTTDGSRDQVASPSLWIDVLVECLYGEDMRSEDLREPRTLVAENIGPLVRCMIDDSRRELFGDNLFWHMSAGSFVSLLWNLVTTRSTVSILLQYDGLADMVIQCSE